MLRGTVTVQWLSKWLVDQGPGFALAATISETGYVLLPSRDMTEILLKRRKSSKQPIMVLRKILGDFIWYYMYKVRTITNRNSRNKESSDLTFY